MKALNDPNNADEDDDCSPADLDACNSDRQCDDKDAAADRPPLVQIFYCSRTHSQLAQLLRELQRCSAHVRDIRTCTLASRQTLCVNDAVRSLTSAAAVNDRCAQLLQAKPTTAKAGKIVTDMEDAIALRVHTAASSSCPFHNAEREAQLGEQYLARVRDADASVRLGRQLHACPYYAIRRVSLPYAQLVLCPYQILLSEEARAAWGVQLKGAVVIVDEAHNLIEALGAMHSVDVTGEQRWPYHGSRVSDDRPVFTGRAAASADGHNFA